MEIIAEIFEAFMIISFGVSWPINVIKGYRSRTAKGKSVLFNYLILFGYFCGVASKILSHNFNLAFYFYFRRILFKKSSYVRGYGSFKRGFIALFIGQTC